MRVSWSCASAFVSGSCERVWWPFSILSQCMRASPTEFVIWNVATRAKSAAKLCTSRSICILLMRGMLSFSSRMPGSSSGTAWPSSAPLGVLVEETAVLGAQPVADLAHVLPQVIEDAPERLAVLHAPVELLEELVGIVDGRQGLVRPGVGDAGPGVGPGGHQDAQLERPAPRAGGGGRPERKSA